MKTPFDPRHQRRRNAIKAIFAWGFRNIAQGNELAHEVINNLEKVDSIIRDCAPEWPLEQINRVDLSILRLALYELVISAKEPPKVVIDEAIELAKEFGAESSPSFVNGVLGTALKKWTNK